MGDIRSQDALSTWDVADASRYEVAKHGPDGKRFLDPHLYRWMTQDNLKGSEFLDIGCGTGPWSEFALEQGVNSASLLDLNPAMIAKAEERLSASSHARFDIGNTEALPYEDKFFDRLISINVGCCLPSDAFRKHFKEAARVAMKGARFLVAAPDSLRVPFTNSLPGLDVQRKIDELWESFFAERNPKKLIEEVNHLLRATFLLDYQGKPHLVKEAKEGGKHFVRLGQPIIRRIPGLAVDNNFHTATEYLDAARKAGWRLTALHRDKFEKPAERQDYNRGKSEDEQLGQEYEYKSPFLVMELEKN